MPKLLTRLLALSVPVLTLALAPAVLADTRADSQADRARYKLHLDTLADPALEGRGPGLAGNRTAAEYLEQQFKSLGLQPAFPTGHRPDAVREEPSFYQQFNAGREVKVRESTVSFTPVGDQVDPRVERQTFAAGEDYTVIGSSGSATAEGELVFVGYSIESGDGPGAVKPEDASYIESDDFTGKIAVLFRFEPLNEAGKSRLSEKGGWSNASAISAKLMAAVKRNAAGIILVSPPGVDDKRAGRLEKPEVTSTWTRGLEIPAVMLSQQAAERLVKAADGRSLWELRKLADRARADLTDEQSAVVAMPGARVKLHVASERVDRVTWNVGGILPGKGDLASQFIVIGAHFDHVGYGYTGGSRSNELGVIHPGADDNASGTSGLLLVAEALARTFGASDQPRRSILFLGFSAEEMGLIGSREYIKASPVDAKAISAMLNMDMIGRLRNNKLMIAGTGTAEGFADFLKPIFDASGLSIEPSPGGRGPSDHATFYGAGVPVLHFFTGLHEEYHTPRDTADLINVEGAVRIVEMVTDLAVQLATRTDQLAYTTTDRGGRRAAGDPDAGPSMRNVRVRFGIAPANYAEGGDGVGVGEVFDGTSAAEAGIRTGDRLTRWNGEPLEDVQSWMGFLAKHKPGDVVDVTLVRPKDPKNKDAGSEELIVRVTLKARDQEAR